METINQFVTRLGITMTAVQVDKNPNMLASDSFAKQASHWEVTLILGQRSLKTFFSMGSGHPRRWKTREQLKKIGWGCYWGDVCESFVGANEKDLTKIGYASGREVDTASIPSTIFHKNLVKELSEPMPPKVENLLDCLANDAQTVEDSKSFEDWAFMLGYDPDSRSAEKTYKACERNANDLRKFLSGLECHNLIVAVERL